MGESIDDFDASLWHQMMGRVNRKTIVMRDAEQHILDSENYCGRPVLGKIVVLPKSALAEFHCEKPWACISVIGSSEIFLPVIGKENAVGKLTLRFDDIEVEQRGSYKMMTESQAQQVVEFVNNVWEHIDILMIHCTAGISRSPAIAKAISEVYQQEYADYFSQLYSPNKLVYAKLKALITN